MSDKNAVFDNDARADECVARYLAVAADDSASLNLNESAYSGPLTDPAAVQIHELRLRNGDAGSENNIVSDHSFLVYQRQHHL